MSPITPQPSDSSASTAREHAVPGSLSAEDFKTVFRGHPGGVAVITADSPDGPVALTATSVASAAFLMMFPNAWFIKRLSNKPLSGVSP